jgi:hypothetical protein
MQFAGVASLIIKVPFNTKFILLLDDIHAELPCQVLTLRHCHTGFYFKLYQQQNVKAYEKKQVGAPTLPSAVI